jgi:hypothetical protein
VSLQPAVGGKALPTALPVACKSPLNDGVAMGVLHVTLKMILPWECLVAAGLGAGKWSLLVVASHVLFETDWSVEALVAAFESADIVPLTACLTIRPQCAFLGVIDLVVIARIVRIPAWLNFYVRICQEGLLVLWTTSLRDEDIPICNFFRDAACAASMALRFRTMAARGVDVKNAACGAEVSRQVCGPTVFSTPRFRDASDPCPVALSKGFFD